MFITTQRIISILLSNTSQFYVEKSLFDLSIIIPVYNNQEKIVEVINKIESALESCVDNYELIVVNDGSTDATLSVLEDAKRTNTKIRILSYPMNKGKGHAVKTGVMACHGSKCLFIDGDLDVSPSSIGCYFSELENCDLVVASKRHKLSNVKCTMTRKFLSHAFSVFVRLTTGVSVKDTQSGLKAGDSFALKRIFSTMTVCRYAFDVELLVIAKLAGLEVREMPVDLRLTSKFKAKDIVRMSCDVLRIAYRYRLQHTTPTEIIQIPN
jgi:glycosyltransferase involved in cell wall biosynthesis